MAGPDYDAGLEKFAPARRNDLISGAGLAATYVGGVNLYGFPGEEKTVISDMHRGAMSRRTRGDEADQPRHADRDGAGQVRA